jgi:hypothetical protein
MEPVEKSPATARRIPIGMWKRLLMIVSMNISPKGYPRADAVVNS